MSVYSCAGRRKMQGPAGNLGSHMSASLVHCFIPEYVPSFKVRLNVIYVGPQKEGRQTTILGMSWLRLLLSNGVRNRGNDARRQRGGVERQREKREVMRGRRIVPRINGDGGRAIELQKQYSLSYSTFLVGYFASYANTEFLSKPWLSVVPQICSKP